MNPKTSTSGDEVDQYLEQLTEALQHGSDSDEVKRLLSSPPRHELLRLAEDAVELRRAYESTLANERSSPKGILSPPLALGGKAQTGTKRRSVDVPSALVAIALVLACTAMMFSQRPATEYALQPADAKRIAEAAAKEALEGHPVVTSAELSQISPRAVAEELVTNDQFRTVVQDAVSSALSVSPPGYLVSLARPEADGQATVWATTAIGDVIEAFQPRHSPRIPGAPVLAIMADSDGKPTEVFLMDPATQTGKKFDVDPNTSEPSDLAAIESADKRKLQTILDVLQKAGAKAAAGQRHEPVAKGPETVAPK